MGWAVQAAQCVEKLNKWMWKARGAPGCANLCNWNAIGDHDPEQMLHNLLTGMIWRVVRFRKGLV